MKSGIYKIHWDNNQYFYFGQAQDLEKRKKIHIGRLKANTHDNYKLQQVFNKYGIPKISTLNVLLICDLDKAEESLIMIHFHDKFCCNLVSCVKGSRGRIITDGLRQKLSDARKSLSEESRINISNGQKGKTNPQSQKDAARLFMLNVSQDYKDKMRVIKTGTYTGSQNHSSKIILDTANGIFYDCLKEASNFYSYKYGYLKMMLSGKSRNKTTLIYC